VSFSVSFAFVRAGPSTDARTLRRRSRTEPIGDGHCTVVLKIGKLAVSTVNILLANSLRQLAVLLGPELTS
jgi:hypothetical protein